MSYRNGNHQKGHTILLGGIGGDCHSVGLSILRQALAASGYRVSYIGTQNRLEDFFQLAGFCNVVMISSMDGHAPYYLRQFPELVQQYHTTTGPLWYLGGNLHIGEGLGYEREFLNMGFDKVFVKFVDIKAVLEILERDLQEVEPVAECPALWEQALTDERLLVGAVADCLLDAEEFERNRKEVLEHWRTGPLAKEMVENASFMSAQPSFVQAQLAVNTGRAPMLVQPRSGVPLVNKQIRLFKAFKQAGARVLSYQVDSLTRNNNYVGAEEAIRESRLTGSSTLNGYPVVNHGPKSLRRIISEVKVPLQTRHSTRDPRLLAEISYAGAVTSYEGGAICYNIPYYKNYPLDESIKRWQYVDRLTGLYQERFGIILDREFFGTLTATLIPPSLALAVDIIEAMLAVRQGVKSVSLGYAEQGHRVQDIAAIRMLRTLAAEYLANLGYKDVHISTVFHQYMAAFPPHPERAADLIYNSAATAALSGATRVIVKTPAEAYKIPTMEDNIYGMDLVHRGIAEAKGSPLIEARLAEECERIRQEVEAIIESVIFCGHGDIAQGVVTGFEKGLLDIPFSPSIYNRGEVMTARDTEGAVRFLSLGQLQLGRELRQFHEEKMSERRRAEGLVSRRMDYLLVQQDAMKIARSEYESWPLFG
ncbi:MAG: methylaspartate mutase sigma subunit [Blastocatellia bacterium]|jgi:methylaspartate mutase epsilon subunit|nr:methylaspartate mutase sigma subunit [Blastocatellia bacterium]